MKKNTDMVNFTDKIIVQLYFQFLDLKHNLERVSNVDKIFCPISKSVLNSAHNEKCFTDNFFIIFQLISAEIGLKISWKEMNM